MSANPRLAFGLPLALVAALLVLKGIDHGDGAAEPVTNLSASDRSKENELTGRAPVVDGDTLEIRGTRIRLHGIDAPVRSKGGCGQAHSTSPSAGGERIQGGHNDE